MTSVWVCVCVCCFTTARAPWFTPTPPVAPQSPNLLSFMWHLWFHRYKGVECSFNKGCTSYLHHGGEGGGGGKPASPRQPPYQSFRPQGHSRSQWITRTDCHSSPAGHTLCQLQITLDTIQKGNWTLKYQTMTNFCRFFFSLSISCKSNEGVREGPHGPLFYQTQIFEYPRCSERSTSPEETSQLLQDEKGQSQIYAYVVRQWVYYLMVLAMKNVILSTEDCNM